MTTAEVLRQTIQLLLVRRPTSGLRKVTANGCVGVFFVVATASTFESTAGRIEVNWTSVYDPQPGKTRAAKVGDRCE